MINSGAPPRVGGEAVGAAPPEHTLTGRGALDIDGNAKREKDRLPESSLGPQNKSQSCRRAANRSITFN